MVWQLFGTSWVYCYCFISLYGCTSSLTSLMIFLVTIHVFPIKANVVVWFKYCIFYKASNSLFVRFQL